MSVMSRTHFRLVANAIRFVRLHYYAHSSTDALYQLARVLSDQFSSTNPRFDDALWMKACGMTDHLVPETREVLGHSQGYAPKVINLDEEDPIVLVEAREGQTLEEWQEEMAELRQRAEETLT